MIACLWSALIGFILGCVGWWLYRHGVDGAENMWIGCWIGCVVMLILGFAVGDLTVKTVALLQVLALSVFLIGRASTEPATLSRILISLTATALFVTSTVRAYHLTRKGNPL